MSTDQEISDLANIAKQSDRDLDNIATDLNNQESLASTLATKLDRNLDNIETELDVVDDLAKSNVT